MLERCRVRRSILAAACTVLAAIPALATADTAAASSQEALKQLSLEALMNVKVSSVARREENVFTSAAAVHVISQNDIRRSGVTTIADALTLAPGMEVGRISSQTWAVSARGFNDAFANKLLVLMDGRSVYTPLFSGVYWEVQDTLLEDIDRIEVIRGPGATLWGANAVNGVINVISKSARDTQGTLLSTGGGTEERAFGSVRYGARLGESTFFRVYGKYFDRDAAAIPGGVDDENDWWMGRGGFRIDSYLNERSQLTLQGEGYSGRAQAAPLIYSLVPPFAQNILHRNRLEGGHILGRWRTEISETSGLAVQFYYDRTVRDTLELLEKRDTVDLDVQHRFGLGERHTFIWGGGYRYSADDTGPSFTVGTSDPSRGIKLASAFLQDEIDLVRDRLRLTLGTKIEHNDFTGFETQPGGRLAWTPSDKHTLWTSVARAVRTPSRAEHAARLVQGVIPPGTPFPPFPAQAVPIVLTANGSPSFRSEKLMAYELGYRVRPHARVSVDVATFYNCYDDLRSIEPGSPSLVMGAIPYLEVPSAAGDGLFGESYGTELSLIWQAADWWRLQTTYTFHEIQLHKHPGSGDIFLETGTEGSSPAHQFALRSSFDLPGRVSLDMALRFVDELPAFEIDSYVTLDARLAWRPAKNLELSITGQSLLDNQRPEFKNSFGLGTASEIERSVYGKLTWSF